MPSLFDKVGRFSRSPQGKKLMGQAQRLARDPRTRQRLEGFRRRFARR